MIENLWNSFSKNFALISLQNVCKQRDQRTDRWQDGCKIVTSDPIGTMLMVIVVVWVRGAGVVLLPGDFEFIRHNSPLYFHFLVHACVPSQFPALVPMPVEQLKLHHDKFQAIVGFADCRDCFPCDKYAEAKKEKGKLWNSSLHCSLNLTGLP